MSAFEQRRVLVHRRPRLHRRQPVASGWCRSARAVTVVTPSIDRHHDAAADARVARRSRRRRRSARRGGDAAAVAGQDVVFNLAGQSGAVQQHGRSASPTSTSTAAATWCCSRRCARAIRSAKLVFVGSRLAYGRAGADAGDRRSTRRIRPCVHAVHKLTVEQYLQRLRARVRPALHDRAADQSVRSRTAAAPHGLRRRQPHDSPGARGRRGCRSTATARSSATTSTSTMWSRRCCELAESRGQQRQHLQRRQRRRHARSSTWRERSSAMAGGGRIEHVAWPPLAEQIETGDFVADISRIQRELGWEPRVVARRRAGADGGVLPGPRRVSDARIRVVYLAHAFMVGGAEEMVLNLVRHLPPRFEPVVCCIHEAGPIGEEIRAHRPPVTRARPHAGLRRPCDVARHRAATFATLEPQIVHTFLLTASLYGRLAAILARVPIVIGTEVNIYEQKRPHPRAGRAAADGGHRSRGRVGRIGARLLHRRRSTPIRRRST